MTSVKVKFRPSTTIGKEGAIYYQIIHKRKVRQLKTDYHIFPQEWHESTGILIPDNNQRCYYLYSIKQRIDWDITRLKNIIEHAESELNKYTANDIISIFEKQKSENSLFNFMYSTIAQLKQMGKHRTSETYRAALNSFMQFRDGNDILIDEIDSTLILMYEAYLHNKGITKNSSSFYMRILRAVYNRAVERELSPQRFPFKHVYTGVDKTIKRAIPLKAIKQIKNLDLSANPSLDLARDMFMFSFYTRGMSFIDMTYLKKKDLANGILTYRRRKTGQKLFIKWEKCMQEIIDKHTSPQSEWLLPIINSQTIDQRQQYQNALRLVNYKLKKIKQLINLPIPLTTYVAHHSWASIARSKNIPISIISEGMGHDSELTTQIYLSSLDTSAIDNANKLILKNL